ncbi:hypothetical protein ACLOJK_012128, partial [Asimina triloba]
QAGRPNSGTGRAGPGRKPPPQLHHDDIEDARCSQPCAACWELGFSLSSVPALRAAAADNDIPLSLVCWLVWKLWCASSAALMLLLGIDRFCG